MPLVLTRRFGEQVNIDLSSLIRKVSLSAARRFEAGEDINEIARSQSVEVGDIQIGCEPKGRQGVRLSLEAHRDLTIRRGELPR